MPFLVVSDIAEFVPGVNATKAKAMIQDAEALAVLAAPCIAEDDFAQTAAVRAILRGAVIRWIESGSGVVQSQTAGPFGQTIDTRQQRRGMFWPSEIEQLQRLCSTTGAGAFGVDTVGIAGPVHLDTCSVNFGSTSCSCGAILVGLANAAYGGSAYSVTDGL